MIFAIAEILIYAASLAGALAVVPFALWLFGFADPSTLLFGILAAPFLMWACGYAHWRAFEWARPHLLAVMYAVGSAAVRAHYLLLRELEYRRKLNIAAAPRAELALPVGKVVS